jgi:eukaryotic-like serine/threonine-protein kinase
MNRRDPEARLAPPRANAAAGSAGVTSYQFDSFFLDSSQRQLTRDGAAIMLPPKAFDMLVVLLENRDRVMGKEELMTAIWRDAFVSEDSLSQIIFILRRSLGDDPSSPRFIATSHRRGYRFIADVKAVVAQAELEPQHEQDAMLRPSAGPTEGAPLPQPHMTPGAEPAVEARRRDRWLFGLVVVASSLVSWFAGHRMLPPKPFSSPARVRSVQGLPAATNLGSGGLLSPDSRLLAYVAGNDHTGKTQLWVRDLGTGTTQPMRDTDGAEEPFWAPDSQRVAFFSGGNLRIADLHGSTAHTIAAAGLHPAGGSWSVGGAILFAPRRSGLSVVASTGGPSRPATTLDAATKESAHRSPRFLPDSRHFLYDAVSAEPNQSGTYIGSLDGKKKAFLVDGAQAVYADPGYLIFVRETVLMAQAFDLSRLQVTGQPTVLAAGVSGDRSISAANGVLAFVESVPSNHLAWFNRSGDQLGQIEAPASLATPMMTRDGKELVASNGDVRGERQGIWLSDLERGVFSRLTVHGSAPVPSPDNAKIVFTSDHVNGVRDLYVLNRSGGTGEEALLRSDENKLANDWTRDGRYIVYVSTSPKTKRDLWLLPMFGDRKPVPFLATPFNEIQGQVSPDGRWMAYASDETGSWDVYVQSFPVPGSKQIVSTSGGGAQPQWRGDGQELFYLSADRRLMSVAIEAASPLRLGRPKALFRTTVADLADGRNRFAPSADGQRFLIDCVDTTTAKPEIVLLINWLTGSDQ